ncbi:MAG TPA: hypothetical protein VFK89_04670 [Actinomycetota bacterium]|nr:hypothetical protein [Actinomycetota bacterium]
MTRDVSRRRARALDDALNGRPLEGADAELVDVARRISSDYELDPAMMRRDRAMFVSGAAMRRSRFAPFRMMVPAIAVCALLLVAAIGGRTALPGQPLYPVRKVLGSVGLARSLQAEFDDHLHRAADFVDHAGDLVATDRAAAVRDAVVALEELGIARDLLDDLPRSSVAAGARTISKLEDQALTIIRNPDEAVPGVDDHGGRDDNGGGSGDDGTGDDSGTSSGHGSDDSGSGSDGSGSGDSDSGSGDRSGSGGSGSDDSGSGTSGSNDSGSGDSGSGDSGSGDSGSNDSGSGTSGSGDSGSGDSGTSDSGSSGSGDSGTSGSGSDDSDASGSGSGDTRDSISGDAFGLDGSSGDTGDDGS